MTLSEIYRCARSLEAIENYSRADIIADEDVHTEPLPGQAEERSFLMDEDFWMDVLGNPENCWGKTYRMVQFALSTWVARVPGLYWRKDAKILRDLARDAVEYKSRDWVTLTPIGKSQIVLGGVGTIKFPPDVNGYRLVSLSAGHNASSGVPTLISPDVWDDHKLDEGAFLVLSGTWLQMGISWAERFPSIQGIPRGYLVVSDSEQVLDVIERKVPIQFHPFTVMEYASGAARLFDFVFATADTRVRDYRGRLKRFFETYKTKKERYGRYLLSADINDPLFDAEYASPTDLRRAGPGAQAQLRVLERRVREQSFQGIAIDSIIQLMAGNYSNERLTRFSTQLGISPSLWFTNAAPADSAVQLMDLCLEQDKVEELLDVIGMENPELIV